MQNILRFIRLHKLTLLLLGLGALYVGFIIFINDPVKGDYQTFVKEPATLNYGIERWFHWSSRLLIESSVNIFSKHLFLWKVVTIALGAVFFWSLGRILKIKSSPQAIVLLCVMLPINMYILSTAGVFATTVNYFWPLACFVFVLAIAHEPLRNKSLRRITQVLIWPLYLFAMCSEQLAILGVLLVGSYIGFKIYKKQRISAIAWGLLLLSLVGVANVLIAPGNAIRKVQETAAWWPGFDQLSLLYKVKIGLIVTFSRLFAAPEIPAVILVILAASLGYVTKNTKAFISILPAVVVVFLLVFPSTYGIAETPLRQPNYFNEIGQRAMLLESRNLPDQQMIREYLIIYATVVISIVTSLVYAFGRSRKTVIITGIMGAGFVTSAVLFLSPTLFASSTRTLYPFLVIVSCVNYYLLNVLIETHFSAGRAKGTS